MRNKIKRSFKRKGFEMVEKQDLHKQASPAPVVGFCCHGCRIACNGYLGKLTWKIKPKFPSLRPTVTPKCSIFLDSIDFSQKDYTNAG